MSTMPDDHDELTDEEIEAQYAENVARFFPTVRRSVQDYVEFTTSAINDLLGGYPWEGTELCEMNIFPAPYHPYVYDLGFLTKYLFVLRDMMDTPFMIPTCTAHEMTLYSIGTNIPDDDLPDFIDSILEDIDFLFLFEWGLADVESLPEEFGAVNLSPEDWLTPFRPHEEIESDNA